MLTLLPLRWAWKRLIVPGVCWSCLVIIVYVVFQLLSMDSTSTMGAVADREDGITVSHTSSHPCVQYARMSIGPPFNSSSRAPDAAVITWRNPRALNVSSALLRRGIDVSLMIGDEIRVLPNILRAIPYSQRNKLSLLDARTQCYQRYMLKLFAQKQIDTIHFVYGEVDFLPWADPHETGKILQCFISVLETLVALRKTTSTSVNVFLHLPRSRRRPLLTRHEGSCWSIKDVFLAEIHTRSASASIVHRSSAHSECILQFDMREYHDVLLKTLHLYAGTYERLHGLEIVVVGGG